MIQRLFSLIAAAMTLAAACAFTEHAAAQSNCGPPCGGDTTQWPWSYPPQPFTAALPLNGCQFNIPPTCCTLTVDYRYREACDNRTKEIEILRIRWDRPCAPNGFDPVPMIRTAVWGILASNPMRYQPRVDDTSMAIDTCFMNYTARVAQCWSQVPGKYAVNCPLQTGTSCCRGFYRVCLRLNNQGVKYREVQWIGNQTSMNNCIDTCISSCAAFDEDGFWNKRPDDPSISSASPATPVQPAGVALKPHDAATEQHTHER